MDLDGSLYLRRDGTGLGVWDLRTRVSSDPVEVLVLFATTTDLQGAPVRVELNLGRGQVVRDSPSSIEVYSVGVARTEGTAHDVGIGRWEGTTRSSRGCGVSAASWPGDSGPPAAP